MATKLKFLAALLMATNVLLAQNTKLDTVKMFQGHWVFKMAVNTDYSPDDLENTYLKNVRGNKIHIEGIRIYGNFHEGWYENQEFDLIKMPTYRDSMYLDNEFNEKDLKELKNLGIIQQPWVGITQEPYHPFVLPYFSLLLLVKQHLLKVGIDETMFFLEPDKVKYLFANKDSVPICNSDFSPTLNHLLKDEEVELLGEKDGWSQIRYWGKALLVGWVKSSELKASTNVPEFWNIYKNNTIRLRIKVNQLFMYKHENLRQATQILEIKGQIVEVVKESGPWIQIIYHGEKPVEGWVRKTNME